MDTIDPSSVLIIVKNCKKTRKKRKNIFQNRIKSDTFPKLGVFNGAGIDIIKSAKEKTER